MISPSWCETYPERGADDPCTYCHHQDLCKELYDPDRCIWQEVDGFLTQDIEQEHILTLLVRSHSTANMSIKRFRLHSAMEKSKRKKE